MYNLHTDQLYEPHSINAEKINISTILKYQITQIPFIFFEKTKKNTQEQT